MWVKKDPDSAWQILCAAMIAVSLWLVFMVAPREAVMGDIQRIFYFHVASSWTGYLALLVTFVSSVAFLRSRTRRWDALALSSAEVGLVFITGGILTGTIWAKHTWGVWWTWDPRLTTSTVLWMVYASYLILRQAMDDPAARARASAGYAIAGFVAAPLNFMAIRWWRAAHPLVLGSAESGAGLDPTMVRVLIFAVATFTVLYIVLIRLRRHLELLRDDLDELSSD